MENKASSPGRGRLSQPGREAVYHLGGYRWGRGWPYGRGRGLGPGTWMTSTTSTGGAQTTGGWCRRRCPSTATNVHPLSQRAAPATIAIISVRLIVVSPTRKVSLAFALHKKGSKCGDGNNSPGVAGSPGPAALMRPRHEPPGSHAYHDQRGELGVGFGRRLWYLCHAIKKEV